MQIEVLAARRTRHTCEAALFKFVRQAMTTKHQKARRAKNESKTGKKGKRIAQPRRSAKPKPQAKDARRASNESKTAKTRKGNAKPRRPAKPKPHTHDARRVTSEPKTAKTGRGIAKPRKSAQPKPQTNDARRSTSESKTAKTGKGIAKPRKAAEPKPQMNDTRRASSESTTAKNGKRITRSRRPAEPKPQTHHASPLRAWSVGAALLLLAAIVGYYYMVQTPQRLETVQTELNTLREDSTLANRRAAKLEETTVGLEAELSQANAARSEIQSSLQQTASQIERLSTSSDAVRSLLERQLTELEALPSRFEAAKRTAEQAGARAAKAELTIDQMRHRQKAMQAELEANRQAALHATSEAEKYKRQTINLKSELERGQQARASLERELDQAKSQIAQLKEASLKAKQPLPKLAHATIAYPPHGAKTRDYLIRTIAFEAGGESELGKAAVAHVVLNRVRSGKWGSSVEDVVKAPWQFEPWMARRKELEKLHPFDPRFQKAARIADAVLAGETPDPTAGATHFLNPVVVRQRRGGSLPLWARRKGQPIGRHVFYSPDGQDAGPERDDARRVSAARPARASSPAGPG